MNMPEQVVSTTMHLVPLTHWVMQHHYLNLVDIDALVLLNGLEVHLQASIRTDNLIMVPVDQVFVTVQTRQNVVSLLRVSKGEVAQEVYRSIGRDLGIVSLDHQLVHFLNVITEPSGRAELLDALVPEMII